MELFPENMKTQSGVTLESIAAKLTYFHEALHLVHWQTKSYAEHQATGGLYDYIHDFKDTLIEKLMGYTGKRPGGYKVDPINPVPASSLVADVMMFATTLKTFGEANGYHDVCNMADDLSGEAAKVKYLLTLS